MKMTSTFLKTIIVTAALLTGALSLPAQARDLQQICYGTLSSDTENGYTLTQQHGIVHFNTTTGAVQGAQPSLWCDASIPEGNLIKQVLKVCHLGGSCMIAGTFEGHGTFVWKHIAIVR
jgi:hypothetical protein